MLSLSLLDVLADETDSGDRQHKLSTMERLAARYVASLLADWERILECEAEIGGQDFGDTVSKEVVDRSLYEVYQKWAGDAEGVLTRTRQLSTSGQRVQRSDALEDAFAKVQARLKLTPEMIERAMAQVREGKAIPMGELRDELRSRIRA